MNYCWDKEMMNYKQDLEVLRRGGFTEYVQAAAVPMSALTAWQALFDHADLSAGQSILIHGASGGVGTFAVQLAHWVGAHVIGTASARNRDARDNQIALETLYGC